MIVKKSLNRMEYWLLNSAIENIPAFNILLDDELKEADNLRPHNCSRAEVIDALLYLFSAGDILASGYRDNVYCLNITLTLTEIETALDDGEEWYYYLTSQGGEKWEAVSQVDWKKYIGGEERIPTHQREESIEEDDEYNPEIYREEWLARISLVRSYIENNGGFDLALSKLEAMSWLLQSRINLIKYYSIVDESQADLPEINREILKQVLILDPLLTGYKFDLLSFKIEE